MALYSHKRELHGVQESEVLVLYRLVLDGKRRVMEQACRLAQDDKVLRVWLVEVYKQAPEHDNC